MNDVNTVFAKDQFAKSCGIEILEAKPGYAKCAMEVTEGHLNGLGILMGGAIFTLADFTFSVAAISHGTEGITLNAFISFLRKCDHGMVTAIATEVSRTSKIGVYRIVVVNETDQPIAEVTVTCSFKSTK